MLKLLFDELYFIISAGKRNFKNAEDRKFVKVHGICKGNFSCKVATTFMKCVVVISFMAGVLNKRCFNEFYGRR